MSNSPQAVLIACIVFVAASLGCDTGGKDEGVLVNRAQTVLKVNAFQVKRESQIVKSSVYFGRLIPKRQSSLGFSKAGTIKTLASRVGEAAIAGNSMAELDQAPLTERKLGLEQRLVEAEQNSPGAPQVNPEQIRDLRSQLAEVNAELAMGQIKAPYDCLISELNFEVGDRVSPERPLFRIVENSAANVSVELPATIADNLTLGQGVWVTVRSVVFSAIIKTKSPTESAVGNKQLLLEINNDPEKVTATMSGQTVRIEFLRKVAADGYWVPRAALVGKPNGLWAVMVTEKPVVLETNQPDPADTTVTQKLVDLILLKDDWAFVEAAFGENEFVISDGTHRVVPGQRVTINDVTLALIPPDRGDSE